MIPQMFRPASITLALVLWSAAGMAQTPYYADKTITIIAGTQPGDVYDLYARHFAQYMPKYIPGTPNIIVQNLPGADSMIAANYVYNSVSPDGLTIGAILPELYFDQLVEHHEVKFDWSKFAWLGSPVTSNHLLYMRSGSPFKTIKHVVKASPGPKCGATGTNSPSYYVPKLLDEVIGTNFEVVLEYQAEQDIDLAIERNEVVCGVFTRTALLAREPYVTWRRTRLVKPLVQTGRKRDRKIRFTPTIYELMDQYKTPDAGRSLATLVLAAGDFGKPYVMPPNTPIEQREIIRRAFEQVLRDEAAIADAVEKKLEIDPSNGDKLAKLADEMTHQSPDVLANMKKLLKQ